MKKAPFLFASLLMLAIAGCKSTEAPAPGSGLEGTCPAGPTPNELVAFGGRQVTFYKDGQVTRTGEYTVTTAASACLGGNGTTVPALHFTFPAGGAGFSEPQFTLSGNTLTLDYGGPCDAPVDTYERWH